MALVGEALAGYHPRNFVLELWKGSSEWGGLIIAPERYGVEALGTFAYRALHPRGSRRSSAGTSSPTLSWRRAGRHLPARPSRVRGARCRGPARALCAHTTQLGAATRGSSPEAVAVDQKDGTCIRHPGWRTRPRADYPPGGERCHVGTAV